MVQSFWELKNKAQSSPVQTTSEQKRAVQSFWDHYLTQAAKIWDPTNVRSLQEQKIWGLKNVVRSLLVPSFLECYLRDSMISEQKESQSLLVQMTLDPTIADRKSEARSSLAPKILERTTVVLSS